MVKHTRFRAGDSSAGDSGRGRYQDPVITRQSGPRQIFSVLRDPSAAL